MTIARLKRIDFHKYARLIDADDNGTRVLHVCDSHGGHIWSSSGALRAADAAAIALAIQSQARSQTATPVATKLSIGLEVMVQPLQNHEQYTFGYLLAGGGETMDPATTRDLLARLPALAQCLADEYQLLTDSDTTTAELSQRYEELNFIYRLASSIQELRSNDSLFQKLVDICTDHLNIDAAAIVLLKEKGEAYFSRAWSDHISKDAFVAGVNQDALTIVSKTRGSLVINLDHERAALPHLGALNMKFIIAPIFIGDEIMGLLAVACALDKEDFATSDKKLVETMAHQASSIVNICMLTAHTRKLSTVVEQTPDMVMITDRAGVIEYVNPAFEATTGYNRDDAVGKKPSLIKSGKHGETFYRDLWQSILDGHDFRYVFINKKKTGELFYTQQTITPLRDPDGEIRHFVSTAKDVTDQIKSEEEAKKALQQKLEAEALNRAKTKFFSSMTHELRTPLNAIIGFGDLLFEEIQDDGNTKYLGQLDIMIKAGHHLLSIINNVLDMAKVETGKMELYCEQFDVGELVMEVQRAIAPLLQKHNNQIVVDCQADMRPMHSDRTKIKQVLFNLLSNATKFTQDGTITLRAKPDGDDVIFEVADTGIGMTKEQAAKLFQDYTQADAKISRDYGGTGLGLVISKRFCEMMEGSVSVASEQGKGTTFTVRLKNTIQSRENVSFNREAEPTAQ